MGVLRYFNWFIYVSFFAQNSRKSNIWKDDGIPYSQSFITLFSAPMKMTWMVFGNLILDGYCSKCLLLWHERKIQETDVLLYQSGRKFHRTSIKVKCFWCHITPNNRRVKIRYDILATCFKLHCACMFLSSVPEQKKVHHSAWLLF